MQLEALQRSMMAAVDGGPDFVPDGVFAGGRAAALRGLAVHANTISHARLVALEDTFPRTRCLLGHEEFNRLSQAFVETEPAKSQPLATIGRQFPDFLIGHDACGEAGALARFEWAWLASYHAAEADGLGLADLAGLPETELLAIRVARHPAACMVGSGVGAVLEGEVPGIAEAPNIILTRPLADVRAAPATLAMANLFDLLALPREVGELLQAAQEAGAEEQEILPALIALIEAGALMRLDAEGR
ncbi:MAG: DNA-binding domain-containing protein [Novosphingobium sp.]|nr:putative DNA-binding domain-containing protein [Novosphingobium sp.]